MPGHDRIHGYWFKKFTSIHERLALEMNRCLQRAHVPKWMTKRRTIDPKGPKQRNCPKQLQTHNLPTNDVENINSTNKERNLLLAKAMDCLLRNRKDVTKDPEAQQSCFT